MQSYRHAWVPICALNYIMCMDICYDDCKPNMCREIQKQHKSLHTGPRRIFVGRQRPCSMDNCSRIYLPIYLSLSWSLAVSRKLACSLSLSLSVSLSLSLSLPLYLSFAFSIALALTRPLSLSEWLLLPVVCDCSVHICMELCDDLYRQSKLSMEHIGQEKGRWYFVRTHFHDSSYPYLVDFHIFAFNAAFLRHDDYVTSGVRRR